MKCFLLALTHFLFSAQAFADGAPTGSPRHLTARSCEIFLDKLSLFSGNFGARSAVLYVKTHNTQLDGAIAEVGYRHICRNTSQTRTTTCATEWTDAPMKPFLGNSPDFWELDLPFADRNLGNFEYNGAFYVRTDKNTWYWAHAQNDSNFVLNMGTWNWLANLINYPNANTAATQHGGVYYVLNPQRCY